MRPRRDGSEPAGASVAAPREEIKKCVRAGRQRSVVVMPSATSARLDGGVKASIVTTGSHASAKRFIVLRILPMIHC